MTTENDRWLAVKDYALIIILAMMLIGLLYLLFQVNLERQEEVTADAATTALYLEYCDGFDVGQGVALSTLLEDGIVSFAEAESIQTKGCNPLLATQKTLEMVWCEGISHGVAKTFLVFKEKPQVETLTERATESLMTECVKKGIYDGPMEA